LRLEDHWGMSPAVTLPILWCFRETTIPELARKTRFSHLRLCSRGVKPQDVGAGSLHATGGTSKRRNSVSAASQCAEL
jgi:hypothetical protein